MGKDRGPMSGASWELSEGDDLVTIRTPAVRVALRRDSDRWVHELGPADGPSWLASVEDSADSGDPARIVSPVYQEVHHHSFDDDDRRVRLLLSGHLHKHYFSAVLTVEVGDDGATVIDFDVADRCRDQVARLAATYEVRLGEPETAGPRAASWPLGDAVLALAAGDGANLTTAAEGSRPARVEVVANLNPGEYTHRLRYRWTWATRSGRAR